MNTRTRTVLRTLVILGLLNANECLAEKGHRAVIFENTEATQETAPPSDDLKIDSIEITDITNPLRPKRVETKVGSPSFGGLKERTNDERLDEARSVFNFGKEIWDFIKENRAVVNVTNDYANALPPGVDSALTMSGFSNLQSRKYRVTVKNLVGLKLAEVEFAVVHQYGGKHNKTGNYLNSVSIVPRTIWTTWSVGVEGSVRVGAISNVGSQADPIAAMTLEMNLKFTTPVNTLEQTNVFQVRGDSADVTAH